MTVMLTGGAGFIGSHMAAFLLEKEIDFVIVDNLSNSDTRNLEALKLFFGKNISFEQVDIRDKKSMSSIFNNYQINSIIHFASLKSVDESVLNPQLYEDNNVYGAKVLIDLAKEFAISKFIFSSSACVYGEPNFIPLNEDHQLNPINPYGKNKVDIETLLLNDSYFGSQCCTKILRYFNPIGAYAKGVIGENPKGIPKNLMPNILGVVNNLISVLNIYGSDYDTVDGTAIRDYIHIMDLIEAHFLALEDNSLDIKIFNVGTGRGYTVLEIIKTFERVNNISIPLNFLPRREGDVGICYADNSYIKKYLGWLPSRSLENMCKDSYTFSQGNKYFSP